VLAPPCHQLLIALEYIHGAKMVHGDIKPANVLLSADGSMLRLADFGLSRFLAETGGTRMGMSMHGAKRTVNPTMGGDTIVGTLGYLSPEGYAGRSHVKEPADIWAFGVMACELASGIAPPDMWHKPDSSFVEEQVGKIPREYQPAFETAVRAALDLREAHRPSATATLHAAPFLDFVVMDQYKRHRPPEKAGMAINNADAQPHTSTMDTMRTLIDTMPLLEPMRENGLVWIRERADDDVRLCECNVGGIGTDAGASAAGDHGDPSTRAAAKLLAMLDQASSHVSATSIATQHTVDKVVLCKSNSRSMAFTLAAKKLSQRAADTSTFGLANEMRAGVGASSDTAPDGNEEARKKVLERFLTWPSLWCDKRLEHSRVLLVYHTPPSEEIARKILLGGFANLGKRDAGFYGSGIYVTLDLDYCMEYATEKRGSTPVIVCAFVMGVAFPVVESPKNSNGFLGKPLVNKADTHLVVVSRSDGASEPIQFESWASTRTCTELVAQNDSQVLPLGYMMLTKKGLEVQRQSSRELQE